MISATKDLTYTQMCNNVADMKDMGQVKFNTEALALALDAVRAAKGLGWPEVSIEAGVSQSTLCRIRLGKNPDADSLAKLVFWCDVDFQHFITHV